MQQCLLAMASFRTLHKSAVTGMAALLAVLLCSADRAHAEPLLLSVEAHAALPLTAPQSDLFGPGGSIAAALHYPITPMLLLGVRLRAGLLSNGDAPTQPGVDDPGLGSFELLTLHLRLRPFGSSRDVRRAPGLFVDVGGGGGLTGKTARPSLEAGIGYGFAVAGISLAPSVRYVQVIQPSDVLSAQDARMLLAGLELTLTDGRPAPPPPPPPKPAVPRDRDHDGILDRDDKCPDAAEDFDKFEDQDGCPEPDNDADGVPDKSDACPMDPEDRDGFEDQDGCPEPDNDSDGILDENDKCPNEPEVVNGNDDEDGCPDEGEIVLEHGRIVLEEQVLFDYQYSRVKHRARPVLAAIAKLISQHPEWVSVHIEGHADTRGPKWANQMLSDQRANNVKAALVALGVPDSKLTAAGYGNTRLRDRGDTEEAHQRNRRVEFVIETAGQGGVTHATPAEPPPAAAAAKAKPAAVPKPEATKPAPEKHDAPEAAKPKATPVEPSKPEAMSADSAKPKPKAVQPATAEPAPRKPAPAGKSGLAPEQTTPKPEAQ